jgi:hypothetical protein
LISWSNRFATISSAEPPDIRSPEDWRYQRCAASVHDFSATWNRVGKTYAQDWLRAHGVEPPDRANDIR